MRDWRYACLGACARVLPCARAGSAWVVATPGHLGDILHAVPMLKALRAAQPSKRLVWLVGPWSEALARRYAACVDEIRVFGPATATYMRGNLCWHQGAWRQWRLTLDLRQEGVEVLIAPGDGFGRFLANATCPRVWTGIGERIPPRVRPGIEVHVQPYERDRYEADALAGLLHPLGIAARADHLEYVVTPDERQQALDFLVSEGVDSTRSLAIIAPGSGWSGKNWLPDRFGEVAGWLERNKGCRVVWVGTAEERTLVPSGRAGDVNWTGRTSLALLAAVMERADLFIGNDSGLLHVAAALDVPTVSVWGPTSPGKWGPKGAIHRQIRKVERCAGCIYWDYRETCRHDLACMKAITVQDVLDAIPALAARPI